VQDFDWSKYEPITGDSPEELSSMERHLQAKALQTLDELMDSGAKGDEVRRQAAKDVLQHFGTQPQVPQTQNMNFIGVEGFKALVDGLQQTKELVSNERSDTRRVSTKSPEEGNEQ